MMVLCPPEALFLTIKPSLLGHVCAVLSWANFMNN